MSSGNFVKLEGSPGIMVDARGRLKGTNLVTIEPSIEKGTGYRYVAASTAEGKIVKRYVKVEVYRHHCGKPYKELKALTPDKVAVLDGKESHMALANLSVEPAEVKKYAEAKKAEAKAKADAEKQEAEAKAKADAEKQEAEAKAKAGTQSKGKSKGETAAPAKR